MRTAAEECLSMDSREWTCQHSMSLVHSFSGEPELALAASKRALEVSRDHPTVRSIYGATLASLGDPEEAIEHLESAISESAEDSEAWRMYGWLALAHFSAERYRTARQLAQRALDFNANNDLNQRADVYQLLAAIQSHLDESDQALRALRQAKRLRPRPRWRPGVRPYCELGAGSSPPLSRRPPPGRAGRLTTGL